MQQSTIVFLSGLIILGFLFWYLASDEIDRKRKVGTVLITSIILLCVWALLPRTESSGFTAGELAELPAGTGWELTAEVIPAKDKKGKEIEIKKETLDARIRTLQKRLEIDSKGATFTAVPARTITISMPGFSKADAEEVREKIIADQPVDALKPGIDLAGGAAFTVMVQPKKDDATGEVTPVDADAVQQAIKTLQGRLNPDGTKDMLIQPQGEDMIIIEMPGVSEEEADRVEVVIKKQSVLELRAVHPQSSSLAPRVAAAETVVPGYSLYKREYVDEKTGEKRSEDLLLEKRGELKGKHVKKAWPDSARAGVINVELTSTGGKFMRKLTEPMTKGVDRLAVVLDGVVKSAPTVNDTLSRNFIIMGIDDNQERKDLSSTLMNPLENPLLIKKRSSVTARLGAATVSQGIYAGMAGVGLTLIFLIVYYRIAGLVALIGLTVNVLILFGAMAMFEFTFTLPGIAGIILTIGVAVDANVLIYERLREELKAGKSAGAAIQSAYEKAFSAIFDANITTLITAIILFWRASGTVKGFAITLTIGILASMFAALVVTRVVFWWGARGNVVNKLSFMHLVPEKSINFISMRKTAFTCSIAFLVGSLLIAGTKRENALGIDFAGGSLLLFQTEDQTVEVSEVESAIAGLSLEKVPIIQNETEPPPSNKQILSIRCDDRDVNEIKAALREKVDILKLKRDVAAVSTPAPAEPDDSTAAADEEDTPAAVEPWSYGSSQDTVEASLGKDFLVNSIVALGLGLIAILLYITIRFEFSFAVGAFAALFHDVIICVGIIMLAGWELSLIHVGAILTIAGYSINDTIVVFDRIRESLRLKRGEVEDVMNMAINATLSRTVLTSVTTFVAVFVLFIFGGPPLKAFSFAIMMGVIVGTYSSIFVASPMVLIWSRMRGINLRRELLDANLEAQVNPARG